VVPPARHPNGGVADAYPRVEPRAQRPERTLIGGHGAPSEAEGRSQESGALVEHGLFDDLVRSPEHRRRDLQAQRLGGLEVDHQLELGGVGCSEIGVTRPRADGTRLPQCGPHGPTSAWNFVNDACTFLAMDVFSDSSLTTSVASFLRSRNTGTGSWST